MEEWEIIPNPKDGLRGMITTLASGLNKPGFLALDSTNVYYNEYNAGTVSKIPKAGGTPTTIASGLTYPLRVVTDGTEVFIQDGLNGETIKKVSVGGGTVTTLVSGGTAGRNRLFLTANEVYCVKGNTSIARAIKHRRLGGETNPGGETQRTQPTPPRT